MNLVNLVFVMVNQNKSTKHLILQILRESNQCVSGEVLAQQTSVSRVAVWKAIQALQASGYGIESTKNGYILQNDLKDGLFPWEFDKNEEIFAHFAQTASTMTEAKKIAESTTDSAVKIITADRQTQGQGHANHKWTTTDGSLAATIITKNSILQAESNRLLMAAQIALVKVLNNLTGRQFFVRWPNDIWSEKGKVAGILDEVSAKGGICQWVNLGIGLNLLNKPELKETDVVCTGLQISRKEILNLFWEEYKIQEKTALDANSDLVNQWNALCCDFGHSVQTTQNRKKAVFGGVNAYGWGIFNFEDSQQTLPPALISYAKHSCVTN